MTSKLTGFSPRSARRVAGVWTVFVLASAGWALGGQLGAVMAVVVGVALVFVQWWGQPAWSWAVLGLRGRRPVKWNDPITLANNRSGGGVRVQDGVAVVAVQLLGRAHRATTVTGSVTVESDNVIDVVELAPLLRHPLDLELDSISVVTFGSRTGTVGDYPRVYDAEIGTAVCRAARNVADHAASGDRQHPSFTLAYQRWGRCHFGRPTRCQLPALSGLARQTGHRNRLG